jgi:hypothetical protein
MITPKPEIIVCQSCGFVYNRIINTRKCKISNTGEHHWGKFDLSQLNIANIDFEQNSQERKAYGADDKFIE